STAPSAAVAAAYTAAQGEADREIIAANAALEAAAARTRAANTYTGAAGQSYQTAALQQRAFSDRVAGYFGAGTAFLTTGKEALGNLFASSGGPLDLSPPGMGPYVNAGGEMGALYAPMNLPTGVSGLY